MGLALEWKKQECQCAHLLISAITLSLLNEPWMSAEWLLFMLLRQGVSFADGTWTMLTQSSQSQTPTIQSLPLKPNGPSWLHPCSEVNPYSDGSQWSCRLAVLMKNTLFECIPVLIVSVNRIRSVIGPCPWWAYCFKVSHETWSFWSTSKCQGVLHKCNDKQGRRSRLPFSFYSTILAPFLEYECSPQIMKPSLSYKEVLLIGTWCIRQLDKACINETFTLARRTRGAEREEKRDILNDTANLWFSVFISQ